MLKINANSNSIATMRTTKKATMGDSKMPKTKMQLAAKKAQNTILRKFKKEANERGIPVEQVRAEYYKERGKKMWAKRQRATTPTTTPKVSVTPKVAVVPDLSHLSKNPNKRFVYEMLLMHQANMTIPVHAVTMPSSNVDFETALIGQGVESLTFIERHAKTAEEISQNFKHVEHNLIVGKFPEQVNIPSNANYIWLDLMGKFLDRNFAAVEEVLANSCQTEMVLAITIGNRGPTGTSNATEVRNQIAQNFYKYGWKENMVSINRYRGGDGNTPMQLLTFNLSNPSNKGKNAKVMEIKRQIAQLEKELEEEKKKNAEAQARVDALTTPETPETITRRARYGENGCKAGKRCGRN
jgi:cell division protein FtsB